MNHAELTVWNCQQDQAMPDMAVGYPNGDNCHKPHLMITSTCRNPRSAFQSFFSTFTQISPDFDTLGWNILVRK